MTVTMTFSELLDALSMARGVRSSREIRYEVTVSMQAMSYAMNRYPQCNCSVKLFSSDRSESEARFMLA